GCIAGNDISRTSSGTAEQVAGACGIREGDARAVGDGAVPGGVGSDEVALDNVVRAVDLDAVGVSGNYVSFACACAPDRVGADVVASDKIAVGRGELQAIQVAGQDVACARARAPDGIGRGAVDQDAGISIPHVGRTVRIHPDIVSLDDVSGAAQDVHTGLRV